MDEAALPNVDSDPVSATWHRGMTYGDNISVHATPQWNLGHLEFDEAVIYHGLGPKEAIPMLWLASTSLAWAC